MVIRKYFAVSLVAASLALAGCSSDDDDAGGTTDGVTDGDTTDGDTTDGDTTDGDTTDGDTTDDDPEATNTGNSVLDNVRGTVADDGTTEEIAARADLSTFAALVVQAGLADLLDNEEKTFTVFAPNDDAFTTAGISARAEGEAEDAAADADLADVLSYHVVPGQTIDATAAAGMLDTDIETATGASLQITQVGTGLQVVGGAAAEGEANSTAGVVDTIVAGNGIVHVIDAVLTPAEAPDTDTDTGTDGDTDGGDGAAAGTAFAGIQNDPDLDEFEAIVVQSGFNLSFEDSINDAFVILAPNDDALDDGLTFADQNEAFEFVQGYVVTETGGTGMLTAGTTVNTVGPNARTGLAVEAGAEADSLTVGGIDAELVVDATGGTVYKLDGLLP